jgi:hypothetical protein
LTTKLKEGHREKAKAALVEANSTIEHLQEERRRITPEAVAGEEAAYERLLEIESLIDEAQAERELAETALEELDRREEEERRQAEEERRRKLEARFDELVPKRKKLLWEVEKALDALANKAQALLELDQEQRRVAEECGRYPHAAPYDHIVRDRILARLGNVFVGVSGAARGRHTPLTEDEWFTKTIAEEERAREIREKAQTLTEEPEGGGLLHE